MFCNKCGASLPDDSCFCNKCGNRIQLEDFSNGSVIDEYSVCDVILMSYAQSERQKIVEFLKDELSINLCEANSLLNKKPIIIKGEVVYAEALLLKSQLECFDAKVEIQPMSAERLSYESEYKAICKAFSNMSPDNCIEVLVPRNKAFQKYIQGVQEVYTGGFLSSVANNVFKRKVIKEYESLLPLMNEEFEKSKKLMKQMLEKLNESYNNCYFTQSADDAVGKMADEIALYINNLGQFERFV